MQVSLTVDNPQKVLLMGDAQDFGTCKAAKKNGEPCSQIVNLVGCRDTCAFPLHSGFLSPSMLVCVSPARSTSASTASITSKPSTRRWAPRGRSCSRRSPGKHPIRWRAAAWGSVCVRTASTTGACLRLPAPPRCEWSRGKLGLWLFAALRGNCLRFEFDVGQFEGKRFHCDYVGLSFRCDFKSICNDTLCKVLQLTLTVFLISNCHWIFGIMQFWKRSAVFRWCVPTCCRSASKSNKPGQRTLDNLFIKGSAKLVEQAKRLGELQLTHTHTRSLHKSEWKIFSFHLQSCLSVCSDLIPTRFHSDLKNSILI